MDRRYPERPYVGVGIVVLKGTDVLLAQRGKQPRRGQWSLPGGMQEVGETLHEAARREVMEETGVEIEIVGLIDVIDTIRRDADGRVELHYTLVDYAALWRGGEARAGDDAMGVKWVPVADVPSLGLWSETVRVIQRAAEMAGVGG
jgi:ADP-ribose pyrophosphatase YjhB (NUDIX family)